ncbi:unnamed protein product [Lampetra planeri]
MLACAPCVHADIHARVCTVQRTVHLCRQGRLHGERSAAPSFRGGSLALRERRRRPCQMYADDDETPAVEADPELRLASGKRS